MLAISHVPWLHLHIKDPGLLSFATSSNATVSTTSFNVAGCGNAMAVCTIMICDIEIQTGVFPLRAASAAVHRNSSGK
eukprot:12404893-Karenia_brevis.AAC.1